MSEHKHNEECCSHEHHDHEDGGHEHHHHHEEGLKKQIVKIVIAALLLIAAVIVEKTCGLVKWQLLLVYLVPYLFIGFWCRYCLTSYLSNCTKKCFDFIIFALQ